MSPPHKVREWYFVCHWTEKSEKIVDITKNIKANRNWEGLLRAYQNKYEAEWDWWNYYFHVKEWSDGTFTAE